MAIRFIAKVMRHVGAMDLAAYHCHLVFTYNNVERQGRIFKIGPAQPQIFTAASGRTIARSTGSSNMNM